ncbi:UNVERIFIED_CONTAM: hypothetical protein GTU68_050486 [Idotea baltica]|nr:hypothetical protein [Idotea baltica]
MKNAKPWIDLNCDVGEISSELDNALLPFVSSCSVSCGVHAGDLALIESTIREAIRQGVSVGAHPSYPDRANFGRVSMDIPTNVMAQHLHTQISTVKHIVESAGGQLKHVKPHGALYHDVVRKDELAKALLDVVSAFDSELAIFGQADSKLADLCERKGIRFVHEVFGDRRYVDRHSLVPRSEPTAVIESLADFERQLQHLLSGNIEDQNGQQHRITAQSICLHSDSPHSVEFANRAQQLMRERPASGPQSLEPE